MKNKRTKVGAYDRVLTHWGELLTSDHIDSKSKNMIGIAGEKEAYVIKDLWSGLQNFYPVPIKNAEDTAICIKHFAGIPSLRMGSAINMYSDQSGEIRKACRDLGVLHDKSQPGVPQHNAMIERTNQHILTKTIVSMLEAGLPPCYWSFAAPCVALNMNTDFENGKSAYALTHGEEFSGKRFPFGSKVLYKPSSTKESDSGKWDLAGSVGVFVGYVIHPGYLL